MTVFRRLVSTLAVVVLPLLAAGCAGHAARDGNGGARTAGRPELRPLTARYVDAFASLHADADRVTTLESALLS